MKEFINFIVKNNWGDIASVIGLIITIISFIVILINVLRSRRAAEQAKIAVAQVRDDLSKVDTVAEFSTALSAMEEIRRLHRKDAWEILPDRYSSLRKSLISIRSSNPDMLKEYKKAFQSAIQIFSSIEDQVEVALSQKKSPPDAAELNKVISIQIDKLQEILIEMKNQIGR
jgi:hypothetical protein